MKKLSFFLILAFIFSVSNTALIAQEVDNDEKSKWITLGKISFKKEYDDLLGFKVDVPIFSDEVKDLEGEYITLKGYIVPTEGYKTQKEFIFSAFPYNMCFFCGGAGPETVIEVTASEEINFTADQITITGKLGLNDEDINRLMYFMTDVKMVD